MRGDDLKQFIDNASPVDDATKLTAYKAAMFVPSESEEVQILSAQVYYLQRILADLIDSIDWTAVPIPVFKALPGGGGGPVTPPTPPKWPPNA